MKPEQGEIFFCISYQERDKERDKIREMTNHYHGCQRRFIYAMGLERCDIIPAGHEVLIPVGLEYFVEIIP